MVFLVVAVVQTSILLVRNDGDGEPTIPSSSSSSAFHIRDELSVKKHKRNKKHG
jgi:hypothetical protein